MGVAYWGWTKCLFCPEVINPVGVLGPIPVGVIGPIPVGVTGPIPVGVTDPIPVGGADPTPCDVFQELA